MSIYNHLRTKEFFWSLFGVIAGAAITWVFSYYYYVKAGEDLIKETSQLKKETSQLKNLSNTMILALQNIQNPNARTSFSQDGDGNYTKMGVSITAQPAEAKFVGAPGQVSISNNK